MSISPIAVPSAAKWKPIVPNSLQEKENKMPCTIETDITGTLKWLRSPEINYNFNYATGAMAMWGRTVHGECPSGTASIDELQSLQGSGKWKAEDAEFCPYGPEILDMEVTTICKGPGGIPCPFCYKGNSPNGTNMSFDTFKLVFDKINKSRTLTQIAFGADAQAESNSDLWKMMEYARSNSHNKVIPNITVADISDDVADKLALYCGAVAVSRYKNKNFCYDSIQKLVKRGMSQVNIHIMVSEETLGMVHETISDIISADPRLRGLNAIVFLSLKQKGRGVGYTPVSENRFSQIVNTCLALGIPFGFDSCSGPKFLNAVKGLPNEQELTAMCLPCESSLLSSYINEHGVYYPCSFCEKQGEWSEGIDIKTCDDFIKDVWMVEKTGKFREKLCRNCRNCPMYEI